MTCVYIIDKYSSYKNIARVTTYYTLKNDDNI